jgi:hypothetical protein
MALSKIKLYPDGDMWCALIGENLQVGIAGFGRTPTKALFELNYQISEVGGYDRASNHDNVAVLYQEVIDFLIGVKTIESLAISMGVSTKEAEQIINAIKN